MKTQILALALVTLGFQAATLAADKTVFSGQGEVFSHDLVSQGTYQLRVERTDLGGGQVLTDVKVTIPNQPDVNISCKRTVKDNSWTSDCGDAKGGGFCLGELCQDYIAYKDGRAFATTIIHDQGDTTRMLRTELKNGKAVRFYKEKISLQAN